MRSSNIKYIGLDVHKEAISIAVRNGAGNPAAVVPMGYSEQGLPIGAQIVGRPWEDEVVLAVAAKLEKESGPWQAPPILGR